MHTLPENLHQGVKYSSQIESHQAELIREKIIDKKSISISDLQIDYLILDNSVRNNEGEFFSVKVQSLCRFTTN